LRAERKTAQHPVHARQDRAPGWNGEDRSGADVIEARIGEDAARLKRLENPATQYIVRSCDIDKDAVRIAVAALAEQAMSLSHLADSRIASTACLAVIVASFLYHPEKSYAHRKFVVERDRLAEHVLQRANDPEIEGAAIYDRAALREMAAEIRNSMGAKLSQAFDSAGLRAGGETAIFIEPSFDEFWSMHPECAMPQFLIPSYFGVPLLKGLPPVGRACELGIYYSLPSYGPDAASSAITDPELCDEALERGFTSVLRVFSQDTTRTLHCG
jgi:hypothetical protein